MDCIPTLGPNRPKQNGITHANIPRHQPKLSCSPILQEIWRETGNSQIPKQTSFSQHKEVPSALTFRIKLTLKRQTTFEFWFCFPQLFSVFKANLLWSAIGTLILFYGIKYCLFLKLQINPLQSLNLLWLCLLTVLNLFQQINYSEIVKLTKVSQKEITEDWKLLIKTALKKKKKKGLPWAFYW